MFQCFNNRHQQSRALTLTMSQYNIALFLLLFSVVNKIYGLNFATEPNKTTIVSTGSNQTFTWKLLLNEQDKTKKFGVKFGPWNKGQHRFTSDFLMTYDREPSGNETVFKGNQSIVKRLYWTGDLARDYLVAFRLLNAQRQDSGDYGIKVRVDGFPPQFSIRWFTLSVQVGNVIFF